MATSVPLAPFINQVFYVTAAYGNYPSGGRHDGFDLSTGLQGTGELYSIITGRVSRKGYDVDGWGYYIEVIRQDGVRVLYAHMVRPSQLEINNPVNEQEFLGYEGTSGNSTGYHVHVQMWDASGNLMNPASFMGIPNVAGPTDYIFDGTPIPPTPSFVPRVTFPWAIYARKFRNKRQNKKRR